MMFVKMKAVDLVSELHKLMGPDAAFRGSQKRILKRVARGEPRVIAIMPTCGGKSLCVRVVHIPRSRNTVADGLSRTIFPDTDCTTTPVVEHMAQELREKGPDWVWKDGKGGYEAFLKSLTPDQLVKVTTKGTLNSCCPRFTAQEG